MRKLVLRIDEEAYGAIRSFCASCLTDGEPLNPAVSLAKLIVFAIDRGHPRLDVFHRQKGNHDKEDGEETAGQVE